MRLREFEEGILFSSSDILRLDDATYDRVNPGSASASFRLDADGQVYAADQASGGAFTARYNWVTPPGRAAAYDCRWAAVTNTVDTTPGAASTNLALTSDRTWTETNTTTTEFAEFDVSICRSGDTTPIKTARIRLEVDASP